MTRLNTFIGAFIAVMLTACAGSSDTVGYCQRSSICPIVIYEKYPGVFAALPDRMSVSSDKPKNNVTLVWTFADQSKYKFSTKTQSLVDDGVELIDKNGAVIGLHPCFITNDSREDAKYAIEGSFLRCEITDSATFQPVRYRVRFHAADGSAKVVDPTVDSSGGGDQQGRGGPAFIAKDPVYLMVSAVVGILVELPQIGTSDGVKVVWDAGASGVFNEKETPMVFQDSSGNPVNFGNCRTHSDSNGEMQSPTGRYFACRITTANPSFTVKYTATYRDSGISQTKSESITRKP